VVDVAARRATAGPHLGVGEPLAVLAAAERERVTALIRGLTQHMAVLLVEHDIYRVFAIADRITVMNEGKVLVEGNAETVRANADVQRIYIGGHESVAPRERRTTAASGAPLLSVSGINTYYGKSHILHDVSFEVQAGEVVALLGRNGAG